MKHLPLSIALLANAAVGLIFWKALKTEQDRNAQKSERVDSIVVDYHKGSLSLSEILMSLKHVIHELKDRLPPPAEDAGQ